MFIVIVKRLDKPEELSLTCSGIKLLFIVAKIFIAIEETYKNITKIEPEGTYIYDVIFCSSGVEVLQVIVSRDISIPLTKASMA
jgi:hypothetical protein